MFKKFNIPLLILPILIFTLGYLSLLSTTPDKARSQLLFFIVGYAIYIAVSFIDFSIYKLYWKQLYIGISFILILTFIGGVVKFGSSSWLKIGPFIIQPAEFAKIVEIILISSILYINKITFTSFKKTLSLITLTAILCLFVLMQPDFGTTVVMFMILGVMLFYAGLNKLYFLIGISAFGIFSNPLWNILKDYQKRRVLVFLNPSLDILGSGYNVMQALIAVGSGKFFGKGFGYGTQSHLGYLPVYWTDFIFAAFSEEWGFLGVIAVLLLYFVLLFILVYIAYKSKNSMGSLISIGVFGVFFTQFIINVGMNLGLLPVTGLPLPIISYGGSSMIASFVMLGLVQSVWRNS